MEYTYQITCTRAVNKPKMLREVSNECYGNVLYLNYNFIDFNKNIINRNEQVEKLNG